MSQLKLKVYILEDMTLVQAINVPTTDKKI